MVYLHWENRLKHVLMRPCPSVETLIIIEEEHYVTKSKIKILLFR